MSKATSSNDKLREIPSEVCQLERTGDICFTCCSTGWKKKNMKHMSQQCEQTLIAFSFFFSLQLRATPISLVANVRTITESAFSLPFGWGLFARGRFPRSARKLSESVRMVTLHCESGICRYNFGPKTVSPCYVVIYTTFTSQCRLDSTWLWSTAQRGCG